MSNGESVGEALRSAREAKNLTVARVHQDTKISIEVIESLEQDDYGSFASETYLKGFLRSYAQYLGLDGDKLWSRISRKKHDTGEGGAGGPFWDTEESVHEEHLTSPRILRRLVIPVLVVIIIVLAVLLVREHRKVESLTTGAASRRANDGVTAVAQDI